MAQLSKAQAKKDEGNTDGNEAIEGSPFKVKVI
jgi:hypothetical protein